MHLFNVNLQLLPIKGHFFFFHGGTAPLTPFLTTIAKQRGYSAFLVGIMFAVLPIITVLSRPIFGAITDRFRCQKKIFLCSIAIIVLLTTSYAFLPDSPTDVDNQDNVAVLGTYQFWLFFIFLTCRTIALNVNGTLAETICLQALGKDSHKFGAQRVWGCIGWGGVSLLTGWLIDWYSKGKLTKDYTPGVIVSVIFLLADLFDAFKISDCQSAVVSRQMFKDLKKVLKDIKVTTFLIWVVFFGIFYGSISYYLLWHLEELVTKYHPEKYDSLKTLQGILIAVKCFGGETPFFILSGKIIKKAGHVNSMLVGFATLSVRFFFYFIIKNPILVLPVEILSGLGYALPYSAMVAYGGIIAPEGLKGTVQGLISTVFTGVGVSIGSFMTGYLFNKIGSSYTYLVFSIAAIVVCLLQIITMRIISKITKPTTKENVNTNTVASC